MLHRMRRLATRCTLALLLAVPVVLTGCTTSKPTSAGTSSPAASASTASASAASTPPAPPDPLPSACDLLTAQDVAAMLGAGMTRDSLNLRPQFDACEYKSTDGRVAQLLISPD